jgi:hypothetical protein
MKRIHISAFISIFIIALIACNHNAADAPKPDPVTSPDHTSTKIQLVPADSLYGPAFDYNNIIDIADLLKDESKLDSTKYYAVAATVTEVCQNTGCWFRADNGKGGDVFVKLVGPNAEEDELVIPTDSKGKKVVFYGMPSFETVSVEDQKELLHDAHASKDKIEAVKEPKKELRFYAKSVVIIHDEEHK